jgi:hypothetical protein
MNIEILCKRYESWGIDVDVRFQDSHARVYQVTLTFDSDARIASDLESRVLSVLKITGTSSSSLAYLSDISAAETTQICNIDASVFPVEQWAFLSSLAIDDYYTEDEVDTLLSGKSDTSHVHDSRYYTESEITSLLSGKANTSHDHSDMIHDNVSAEINAITAKTGLSLNDIFVIEDYAASWAKKKATLGNMLKVKRGLTSITSDTTISSLTRDETYIVNASSMITLTLPDASTYAGYEITVYLSSDHGVTISPASGNTIGGFSAGPQLYDNRNRVRLLAMSDDNWIILGMLSTYDSGILACSDCTTRALGAAWVAGTWTGTPVAGETFTQYTNAACTTQSTPAMTGIYHFSYGVHVFRNVSGSGGCFITGYYLKGSVSGAVLAITAGPKNVNTVTLFQCAVFVGDKQISKLTYLPAYDAGNEEYEIEPYGYGNYSVGKYISNSYTNLAYELGSAGFQYMNSSRTLVTVASTDAFYRITRQAII